MQVRSSFVPPVPIGGYIQIKSKYRTIWEDKGELHIVTEVQVSGVNDYYYATDKVAWLPSAEVDYKHPADLKSIKKIAEGFVE